MCVFLFLGAEGAVNMHAALGVAALLLVALRTAAWVNDVSPKMYIQFGEYLFLSDIPVTSCTF